MNNAFLAGLMSGMEKVAISPDFYLRRLMGARKQINRMGIPVQKNVGQMTVSKRLAEAATAGVKGKGPRAGSDHLDAAGKMKSDLITTWSPSRKAVKRTPAALQPLADAQGIDRAMLGKQFQGITKGLQQGLSGKEKEIFNRLLLAHEKAEAQALMRHGAKSMNPIGHVHPSVIEREGRAVKLIGKKYPNVAKKFKELRRPESSAFQHPSILEQVKKQSGGELTGGMRPGHFEQWQQAYKKYYP